MIPGKASCFLVGALVAFVLSGCSANLINLEPSRAPDAELTVLKQAVNRAKAAQQCDVLALAEQTEKILLLSSGLHTFQQWVYAERKEGRDYGPEMKKRLENAIESNWEFAEEAVRLYALSAHSDTELSREGMVFAKTAFEVAKVYDGVNRLALGYTIAGIELNSDYLEDTKEAHFSDLMKKGREMDDKQSILTENFVNHIAAQAGSGKATACPSVPVKPDKDIGTPIRILFEGDGVSKDVSKLLEEAVLQAAAKTSLSTREKVTITLKVEAVNKYEVGRVVGNVLSFVTVGYIHFGGGDASLSAFVQEEGGQPMPLVADAYKANAKNTPALVLLVAYWVVGQTEFALLQKDMG